MHIQLVEPTDSHRTEIESYEAAFNAQPLHGSGGLGEFSFQEWIDRVKQLKINPPEGMVRSLQYIAVDTSNRVVGMIQVRLSLNDYLENYGGHIGYSVHPGHRGKGYATEMLKLSLDVAKQHSLARVLVTCDQDNIASARVIEKCGGQFEDSRLEPGAAIPTDRYWIETTL